MTGDYSIYKGRENYERILTEFREFIFNLQLTDFIYDIFEKKTEMDK